MPGNALGTWQHFISVVLRRIKANYKFVTWKDLQESCRLSCQSNEKLRNLSFLCAKFSCMCRGAHAVFWGSGRQIHLVVKYISFCLVIPPKVNCTTTTSGISLERKSGQLRRWYLGSWGIGKAGRSKRDQSKSFGERDALKMHYTGLHSSKSLQQHATSKNMAPWQQYLAISVMSVIEDKFTLLGIRPPSLLPTSLACQRRAVYPSTSVVANHASWCSGREPYAIS